MLQELGTLVFGLSLVVEIPAFARLRLELKSVECLLYRLRPEARHFSPFHTGC